MSIEGGVAKVGLAAVTGEVAAVFVVSSATLALEFIALVEAESIVFGAQIGLAHRFTQIIII